MPRQRRAAQNRAVEEWTQQRLAARKEAAQAVGKGTSQCSHPRARTAGAAAPGRRSANEAPWAQRSLDFPSTSLGARARDRRAEGARRGADGDGGPCAGSRRSGCARWPPSTTLSKLLVRMMEVFEAQAK